LAAQAHVADICAARLAVAIVVNFDHVFRASDWLDGSGYGLSAAEGFEIAF